MRCWKNLTRRSTAYEEKTSGIALTIREANVTLFLTESEVRELLPMERALECVEASFVAQGNDRAINRSRERILLPQVSLHYMAGALPRIAARGHEDLYRHARRLPLSRPAF